MYHIYINVVSEFQNILYFSQNDSNFILVLNHTYLTAHDLKLSLFENTYCICHLASTYFREFLNTCAGT